MKIKEKMNRKDSKRTRNSLKRGGEEERWGAKTGREREKVKIRRSERGRRREDNRITKDISQRSKDKESENIGNEKIGRSQTEKV